MLQIATYRSTSWSILSTAVAIAISTTFLQIWCTKKVLSETIDVNVLPNEFPCTPEEKPQRIEENGLDPEPLADWVPGPGTDSEGSENSWAKNSWGESKPLAAEGPALEKLPVPCSLAPPMRYARHEQIWDPKSHVYVKYTARSPRRIPEDDELPSWFKVYSRRHTYEKDGTSDKHDNFYAYAPEAENPVISVKFYSQALINFLRTELGGKEFFRSRPFVNIHELFRLQDRISVLLERMEQSELQKIDLESKRQLAHSLGVHDALHDDMDEPILLQNFELLSRQLRELFDCLKKEFEPIFKELEMYLLHGHITFYLLGYMLEPGIKLLMYDHSTGDKIAMRMESWEYGISRTNVRSFTVHGTGREWNGSAYSTVPHSRSINEFGGTISLASLPWCALSAEAEKELNERGRIYCQYSGIYHVYNNGPLGGRGRAIVDCTAYEHEGTSSWGSWGPEEAEKVSQVGADSELPEGELCFLPPTVTGFLLRAKKWVTMHVLSLTPIKFDGDAWDHLVLDPDTKLLIRSLVDVTCKGSAKDMIQDVIAGKGGGLVAVLHGKPGTGKTLTAEAVAEHLQRPIYIVSSEELPLDAASLERRLKNILKLATRWDAVLLIDEADVLLEQRSTHELARNAVVSVALRLLEYHYGVIFLTTNRIKAFDEAFLSRFSIGIRYQDLDQPSRLKIWKNFLRLAHTDIIDQQLDFESMREGKSHVFTKDLENLAEKSFNGRSIKNIVRTAQALALANNEPLTVQHLRIVVRSSERFLHDFEEITT